jgi:hypothetical protein
VATILVRPSRIPRFHGGPLTLTLTLTGAGWTGGGTTFTISGVANVTKVGQIVDSGGVAKLVVTTGAGLGTLTVSDGTNSGTTTVARMAGSRGRWFPGLSWTRRRT